MSDDHTARPAQREPIGPIQGQPVTTHPDLSKLSPHQRALRQAVIREFKAKKMRKFVERQVSHINMRIQVGEGIRFLFDEHGRPPANAPLEDIVWQRQQVEYQIKWFEAVLTELQGTLVRIKDIEDQALDFLSSGADQGQVTE
jgi:hypothetical protein